MDNFEQQLRRHYDAQQLPAARVREILAAGQAAAQARRRRRVVWRWAAAAVVMLGLLGTWGSHAQKSARVETATLAPGVIAEDVAAYFSQPDYALPRVSDDPRQLIAWLHSQGGPDRFVVPEPMQGLPSYGCKVLSVRGQNVYLICFLLDGTTTDGVMPGKKRMTAAGPDGQMMGKKAALVHLVVAPKDTFAAPPAQGQRVVLPLADGWHFTSWTDGDQTYVAAGMLPAERLAQLVHAL
jgi:hypothetical protein